MELGGTAELARHVLERAQRRAPGALPAIADEDRERLSAAFASIKKLMKGVSKECERYYGAMATNKCKENEIQHFCKYHGKALEGRSHSPEEKRTEDSRKHNKAQTSQQSPRRPSKDFYIEVSPGTYSVTAISEDMVEQTHIVDVNAGQTIDVTFVL